MVAARGEGKAPADAQLAGRFGAELGARNDRGADAGARVAPPDLLLGRRLEQAQHPVVHAPHGQAPGGGGAALGRGGDDAHMGLDRRVGPAETLRLEQSMGPDLADLIGGLWSNPPVAVGVGRSLGPARREFLNLLDGPGRIG